MVPTNSFGHFCYLYIKFRGCIRSGGFLRGCLEVDSVGIHLPTEKGEQKIFLPHKKRYYSLRRFQTFFPQSNRLNVYTPHISKNGFSSIFFYFFWGGWLIQILSKNSIKLPQSWPQPVISRVKTPVTHL